MKELKNALLIDQLDQKMANLKPLQDAGIPPQGWIHAVRTTLNMSLAQMGKRLGITAVSVREMEERERERSITLKKLTEAGHALGLRFVYGFIPLDSSIEAMIEQRALKMAQEIVQRTSQTMTLEDQQNSRERLERAIRDRAAALKRELPRQLWD